MTPAKTASPYESGWCSTGAHARCQGAYAGVVCCCPHHAEPEPLPRPTAGDLVTVALGVRWAGEDIGGVVLEVVQVADYPASVGGPVFVCRWPGTTTSPEWGVCLQADRIGGAA